MMVMILAYPEVSANAVRRAVRVWGNEIVPGLFPYMILIRYLVSALRSSPIPYPLMIGLLGLIGGAPSGATLISDYARSYDFHSKTLRALCALTGTISPMFLFTVAGGWLGNSKRTILLMVSHYLGAAAAASIVFALTAERATVFEYAPQHRSSQNVAESVIASSIQSVLGIGGCIVFFSSISAVSQTLLPSLPASLSAFSSAALEISGGLRNVIRACTSENLSDILCAAACGFSGMSMIAQNHLLLKDCGIRFGQLVIYGIIRALFSCITMLLLKLLG